MPFMFDKKIMVDLQTVFSREYNITSLHKIRRKNDVQTEFAYLHYVNENNQYKSTLINSIPYVLNLSRTEIPKTPVQLFFPFLLVQTGSKVPKKRKYPKNDKESPV